MAAISERKASRRLTFGRWCGGKSIKDECAKSPLSAHCRMLAAPLFSHLSEPCPAVAEGWPDTCRTLAFLSENRLGYCVSVFSWLGRMGALPILRGCGYRFRRKLRWVSTPSEVWRLLGLCRASLGALGCNLLGMRLLRLLPGIGVGVFRLISLGLFGCCLF